jgi:hypothetical protein
VSSEESWPQQLAKMANMTTYNFGMGGYGSLQYHHLIDEAVKLRPKHIILGLYVANDLNDVCKLIRKMDFWQEWAEERGYDIEPCFNSNGWRRSNNSNGLVRQRYRLVPQTAVASLMAYAWMRASERLSSAKSAVVVREETNPTIIKYRRIVAHKTHMDVKQERISLGFEITKDIIADAKRKSDLNNISFSIALIPSKERVFFDYLIDKGYELPRDYHELINNETKLVNQFLLFGEELAIKTVDVKSYVLRELYKSRNVYTRTDDGHPGRIGYKAYAEAIYASILHETAGEIVD